MPKLKTGLTTSHHALLGLLSLKPAHGYDLLRMLHGDTGAGRIVPLKPATLYAILHDLQARGLIKGQLLSDSYPPRTLFSPTELGQEVFRKWLAEPVRRIREVRSDFLLKIYFAALLAPEEGLRLLDRQIQVIESYVQNLSAELPLYAPDSFDYLVVESKLTAAQNTQVWLERHRQRLEASDKSSIRNEQAV
ncbi:MAG TPA: helix-turn-helix transcriptional regulator [Dehalococcoidia bacterium]|nr:helix-turn-helix transcriptional regulator [Dehalococcoidia bacterium]